ncbi:MAG: hypothetical protein K9J38_01420 [Polynucleobacter sp.]|nr:hypothetical protein [Polynucleobacter sp.]
MKDKITLKLLLILILSHLIPSQVVGFPIQIHQDDLSSDTSMGPAGPITKRVWVSKKDSSLYRLEFDRAKAGLIILEKTRLTFNPIQGWRLTDFDGNFLLAFSQDDIVSKKTQLLKLNTQEWTVMVRGQLIPKEIPGIATETVHSLDLTLVRIH